MVVARASGALMASRLKQNAFLTLERHPFPFPTDSPQESDESAGCPVVDGVPMGADGVPMRRYRGVGRVHIPGFYLCDQMR